VGDLYSDGDLATQRRINLKGVQTVLNLIAEEGMLKKPLPKPEDIVDSSFLDEARKALPR
jgi:hypothetical protein